MFIFRKLVSKISKINKSFQNVQFIFGSKNRWPGTCIIGCGDGFYIKRGVSLMNKNYFKLILLTFIFSTAIAGCSGSVGTAGSGSEVSASTNGGVSKAGSSGSTGGSATGQAFVPPPAVTKGNVVVSNADSQGDVPVVGYEGAVDSDYATESTGYKVVVSTSELSTTSTASLTKHQRKTLLARLSDYITSAFADSLSVSPPSSICGDDDTSATNNGGTDYSCCDIDNTGGFECFYPGTNDDTFYVYVTDGTNLSEVVSDTVNKSLLYYAQNPKDITTGPSYLASGAIGSLLVLGQDRVLSIIDAVGTFMMAGKHSSTYEIGAAVNTDQLAYDSTNLYLAKRSSNVDDGILYDLVSSTGTDFLTNIGAAMVDDTEKYNKVKFASDGKLRFIRKNSTPDELKQENIYYVLDTEDSTENIKFYDNSDSGWADIEVKDTIAFDVDATTGYAVVLFKDGDGNYRMRLADGSGGDYRYGGDVVSGLSGDFIDMQIYHDNSSSSVNGKALLLDQDNNRVGVISYSKQSKTIGISDSDWISLGDGKNPVALTLNAEKDTAYVLNQGDNTVSVIKLKSIIGKPLAVPAISVKEISLSDYMAGKDVKFTSNSLAYHYNKDGNYLIVGASDLKGGIIVDLSTASMTTVTEGLSLDAIKEKMKSTGVTTTPSSGMRF